MRHRGMRIWWRPWKKRCRCGCAWCPCPDSVTMDRPGPDLSRAHPNWNAATARYATTSRNERPLMTPGQEWRTRPGRS